MSEAVASLSPSRFFGHLAWRMRADISDIYADNAQHSSSWPIPLLSLRASGYNIPWVWDCTHLDRSSVLRSKSRLFYLLISSVVISSC